MILARLPVAVLVLAASAATAPAFADQIPKTTLPGVQQPEPIVKPLAEPLEPASKDGDGFIRMGDWDVKISGYLRVDIRAGTLPTQPR
ncbi:hypothetical protein [Mesorhizobium sp. IMUNJ 23232]|uniref:hypothetical protein n=1 Tax=Mesorhizobium sp. IMUNJ 23232 TaxID=3376064 RepID=UPI0037AC834F